MNPLNPAASATMGEQSTPSRNDGVSQPRPNHLAWGGALSQQRYQFCDKKYAPTLSLQNPFGGARL
jgi:hypothetical protein